ncbi:MAG: hypothetical protein WDM81_19305, partial [Rhizomicrobium sp.]
MPLQDADGQLTRGGAILTFAGAANRGSAVFMRGRTAWIVLQGAAPLDAVKLKTSLRNFPSRSKRHRRTASACCASPSRSPSRSAPMPTDRTLKVTIAPEVGEEPIAIGFSRNQDDATHSSLSTLLPGARHPVTLTDP